MIGAVVAVLRQAGKAAARVAGLGLPALGSEARTARLSRVLLAWQGNARCLPLG